MTKKEYDANYLWKLAHPESHGKLREGRQPDGTYIPTKADREYVRRRDLSEENKIRVLGREAYFAEQKLPPGIYSEERKKADEYRKQYESKLKGYAEGGYVGGESEMEKLLEQILGVMQAQDAKIKALEAHFEAETERSAFDSFMERHGSKFEPHLEAIKLSSADDDPVRTAFEITREYEGQDEYSEDAHVDIILADAIERIEHLKEIVPPEVQPALEEAEESLQEAAITNDVAEDLPENAEQAAETAPEEWAKQMKEEIEDEKMLQEEWESSSGRGYVP